MQEIPGGGPEMEMGSGRGPETPADLTRESVATEIGSSEWSDSEKDVQDQYLQDLEDGGILDQSRREDYERKIAAGQSGTAMDLAKFESKLGEPGAAAVYLHYFKAGTGETRGILIQKMQILGDAHHNKLNREGGFRIPNEATLAEIEKLAQRLKPSARSALSAETTYRIAVTDVRRQL